MVIRGEVIDAPLAELLLTVFDFTVRKMKTINLLPQKHLAARFINISLM